MGKHRKTLAARTPSKLNRTCAICAIAGAAGFGLDFARADRRWPTTAATTAGG